MESHSYPALGVASMNKVSGHIEVVANNACKDVIGFLVGIVGAPIGQSEHLLLCQIVGEQRRIVTLDGQLIPIAIGENMGLHTVAHENVTHLGLQVHLSRICILSDSHCL